MLLIRLLLVAFSLSAIDIAGTARAAAADVQTEASQDGNSFQMPTIKAPAVNDAAATGQWSLPAGRVDANSGPLRCLSDGRIPGGADDPSGNFFLAAGTRGGLLMLDLQKPLSITEISSYSWHPGGRSPQVYTLYGASGMEPGFEIPKTVDPRQPLAGWLRLASVDTRKTIQTGGQVAVRIGQIEGVTGQLRYLLFAIEATDPDDRFSHTFFSEIDVVTGDAAGLQRIEAPPVRELKFETADKRYQFTIDTTQAEELETWSEQELRPVIQDWYPRIVDLLPSKDFLAPRQVRFRYLRDAEMRGVPAYASGSTISMNAEWMRGQLQREARGAVVHEMVHVVQQYSGRRRSRAGAVTPGWLVEGIPDYIRWFLYEPETGGARMSSERRRSAKHDASYRISANFIDWVIRNHPTTPALLEKLNAAAREGRYTSDLWQELTGKNEQELAEGWRQAP